MRYKFLAKFQVLGMVASLQPAVDSFACTSMLVGGFDMCNKMSSQLSLLNASSSKSEKFKLKDV